MTSDWLGGGLIIGLAAVLWLIYLLPTWFRRNEFLATERNVVRLQQTLRILAETSEIPDEVRVETNARSVLEQQRLLKKVTVNNTPPEIVAATRVRRSRAVTSAVLFLSLGVAVLGGVQTAVNGAWIILIVGLIATTLCITRLRRLAVEGRAIKIPLTGSVRSTGLAVTAGLAVDELAAFDDDGVDSTDGVDDASADEPAVTGWTPVPLPKPLYAAADRQAATRSFTTVAPSLGYAEQTASQAEAALLAAAAASEQALRAQQAATDARTAAEQAASGAPAEVAPVRAPAPVIPNRFSIMGIVDDRETGSLDVDQVLARRRAG